MQKSADPDVFFLLDMNDKEVTSWKLSFFCFHFKIRNFLKNSLREPKFWLPEPEFWLPELELEEKWPEFAQL